MMELRHPWVFGQKNKRMESLLRTIALFVAIGIYGQAAAEPVVLNAEHVSRLLKGNTAIGKWDGTQYRQYFGDGGMTIYATRQSQSSLGKWRVRKQDKAYESWWQGGGWSAYAIVRDGEELSWKTGAGVAYPFKVVPGQQLIWPAN